MNICKHTLILVLIFSLSSCRNEKNDIKTDTIASDLQVDHFNIWVKNPKKVKERLTDIGFTAVPDSLSKIHHGQGTTGRYFYFLNSYLELIFVYDNNEFDTNNQLNNTLDFAERANFEKNGASPFSIALKLEDYDIKKIPFEKIKYHQDWMEEKSSIYSAKNSKTHLKEPSVFVVYPEIESNTFETLSDLNDIEEKYAFVREWYKHKNGAKRITNIVITSTSLDLKTKTIKVLNGIENLTIKGGKEHLMELYFDHNVQGEVFDLRPELPLIVYL
ncbi:hypothetical protein [uncultured Psychroserpens sp.]|uniref:hypothetical protein n=1 Tax=uncultured Psychroserpens sp. TaxID=255436 RepID=UPI00260FEDD2|nr:hypothetical protein [uncultured Psychroserpens sp.]